MNRHYVKGVRMTETGIERVTYEQCAHVQMTKRFLANPAKFL